MLLMQNNATKAEIASLIDIYKIKEYLSEKLIAGKVKLVSDTKIPVKITNTKNAIKNFSTSIIALFLHFS